MLSTCSASFKFRHNFSHFYSCYMRRKIAPSVVFLLSNPASSFTSSFTTALPTFSSPAVVNRHPLRSFTTLSMSSDPWKFLELRQSVWCQEDSSAIRQQALERCVPPLGGHKGSSGRIGVVGGSARYTGAPYYAGMAALHVGADLAFLFCADEASVPIKCYSPELMVASVYNAADFDQWVKNGEMKIEAAETSIQEMVQKVEELFGNLHALVIGPGLGRCPMVMEATSRIIRKAMERNIPLVLDADALYLLGLAEYHDLLSPSKSPSNDNKSMVVLTPNVMERKRLEGLEKYWDNDRVVLVQKGAEDVIVSAVSGTKSTDICKEIGGLKRSGGIGDVLAGTLGTFMAWNSILTSQGKATKADAPLACWMACSVVKRSTHVAFHKQYRSMTAPDVLAALGPTFHAMTTISESMATHDKGL